eukprot:SAG31_NODE_1151_length_9643_cov_15.981978_2_plen_450_part_00
MAVAARAIGTGSERTEEIAVEGEPQSQSGTEEVSTAPEAQIIDSLVEEAEKNEEAVAAEAAIAVSTPLEITLAIPKMCGALGLHFFAAADGDAPILASIDNDSVAQQLAPQVESGMILLRVGGQACGSSLGGLSFSTVVELIRTGPRPLELTFGPAAILIAADPGPLGLTLRRQTIPICDIAGCVEPAERHTVSEFPVIESIDAGTPAAHTIPALHSGMRLVSIRLRGDKLARPVRRFDKPYDEALLLLKMAKRPIALHFASHLLPAQSAGAGASEEAPEENSRVSKWLKQKVEAVAALSDRASESLGGVAAAWVAPAISAPQKQKQHMTAESTTVDSDETQLTRMGSWSAEKEEIVTAVFEDAGPMGLTFTEAEDGSAILTAVTPDSMGAQQLESSADEARLTAVNGQDIDGLPFNTVIGLLRNATRPTTLKLLRKRATAFDAFAQFS